MLRVIYYKFHVFLPVYFKGFLLLLLCRIEVWSRLPTKTTNTRSLVLYSDTVGFC